MDKKIIIILISLILLLSIGGVNASEKISATPNDYFTYYGYATPAGKTHSFGIEVDSNVYYIDDNVATKLVDYSLKFKEEYNKIQGKSIEGMIEFKNDKAFDFEYVSGQQVGLNHNAKVITKIYYTDGEEIGDTSSETVTDDGYHYSAQYGTYIKEWNDSTGYHMISQDGQWEAHYNEETGELKEKSPYNGWTTNQMN